MLDDVRVAVGIDHGDHRDAELVGLGHRDVLLDGVEHEDGVGQTLHVLDPAKVPLELLELAGQHQRLLLGHRLELAGVAHALVLRHLGDPLGDRLEVGQHSAKPTLVHVRHAALLGIGTDGLLGLALGADEQHPAAAGDEVTNEGVGRLDLLKGLLEVDDVDAGPLAVDESPHPRVPAAGLVSEMDTRFEQLLHCHDSHGRGLPSHRFVSPPPRARRRPWVGGGELVCTDTRRAGTGTKCTGDRPTSLLPLPLGAISSRAIVVTERLAHSLGLADSSDGLIGHSGQQRSMSWPATAEEGTILE